MAEPREDMPGKTKPWTLNELAYKAGPAKAADLDLYQAICSFTDESGTCFPGEATLAQRTRQSDRNLRRCLKSLSEAHWIEVKRGRRANLIFTINLQQLCDRVVESGCKLTDGEKAFVSRFRPDILSTQAKSTVDGAVKTGHSVNQDRTNLSLRPDKIDPPIENRIEPSLEPNSATRIALASPSSEEPMKPSWSEKDVLELWFMYPTPRGSKASGMASVRRGLDDLHGQGFLDAGVQMKLRLRQWLVWYESELRKQKVNPRYFVASPGHAEGWFNPKGKGRRRYMDEEATTALVSPQLAHDPLEKIRRQHAEASAAQKEQENRHANATAA